MLKKELISDKPWKIVSITTFFGAFALCLLATVQKKSIGVPLLPEGYIIPSLFGGFSGAVFGILNIKLFKSNIALQQTNDMLEIRIKEKTQDLEKTVAELQNALSEVKSLSGLLPICSHCKKIRDDKGYWNSIETYIHEHSEARFSHGICQECIKKYYPNYDTDDDKPEKD